jgi:hypothetical protein
MRRPAGAGVVMLEPGRKTPVSQPLASQDVIGARAMLDVRALASADNLRTEIFYASVFFSGLTFVVPERGFEPPTY